MATNFRTLMNDILRVLDPEDEIASGTSSISDSYHKMVAAFVNSIKEEVEDAHQWRALRTKHTATVSADALTGDVTNATERSRLVRIQDARYGRLIPLVYDVTDSDNPINLRELDLPALIHKDSLDPDQRASKAPTYFAVDNAAEDNVKIYVWPRPSAERTIHVYMTTPQERLGDDDLDVNIKVPVRPIRVGALWYALEERGEELGINSLFSEKRFNNALDDSIARDSAEQGDAYELIPQ